MTGSPWFDLGILLAGVGVLSAVIALLVEWFGARRPECGDDDTYGVDRP